ncbi:hypothetical protein J518_3849 [Acinetobacter baumannii 1419130]|nr:hypothetical protein J518_3849 [Acinetobacter baumannii 1419130]
MGWVYKNKRLFNRHKILSDTKLSDLIAESVQNKKTAFIF